MMTGSRGRGGRGSPAGRWWRRGGTIGGFRILWESFPTLRGDGRGPWSSRRGDGRSMNSVREKEKEKGQGIEQAEKEKRFKPSRDAGVSWFVFPMEKETKSIPLFISEKEKSCWFTF